MDSPVALVLTRCADHDRRGHRGLPLLRNQHPHQLDQLWCEERIERKVVDGNVLSVAHGDLAESRLLDLLDEVTLRQGAGYSAGPRRRVQHDLGWKLFIPDRQVGNGELAS
jgi:hypothetical protein